MVAQNPTYRIALATPLCLTGSFAFVLTLMFSPVALTALESGDALALSPFEQTMLCASCMLLAGAALLVGAALARNRRAWLVPLAGSVAIAGPALSFVLAGFVHVPVVPAAVAVLMGVGCMAQLYLGALVCRQLPKPAMCLGTSAALLLATLVGGAAREAFPLASEGAAFLAAVACACGCAAVVLAVRGRAGGEVQTSAPIDDVREVNAGVQGSAGTAGRAGLAGTQPPQAQGAMRGTNATGAATTLTRDLAHLRFDWQPLVGGIICALSFGFVWNQSLVDLSGTQAIASLVGRAAASCILIATFAYGRTRPASATFGFVLSVAAAAGILVWSVNGGVLDAPALLAIANLSQVLFLGLLWIETLYTDSDATIPAVLPICGVSLFLVAFVAGGLLSQVWGPGVTTVIIPLLLIAYVLALLMASLRRGDAERQGDEGEATEGTKADVEGLTYNQLFEGICQKIAHAYRLSPRESEVLPLLMLGLTSNSIGERLFISPQTVKTHAHRIYAKMGIHSRDELAEVFNQHAG